MPSRLLSSLSREEERRGLTTEIVDIDDLETQPKLREDDRLFDMHPDQVLAWESTRRFIAIYAGWQSGKSVCGPPWLLREMQRCGPGDYFVLTPDYPMLSNKALPLLKLWFGIYADYKKADNMFILTVEGSKRLWGKYTSETRILLKHAQDENAIEAFTAKGGWVDEPGQIPDGVIKALQARLAINQARVLYTSRPYEHNWYVRDIWHKCMHTPDDLYEGVPFRREGALDDTEVINFSSLANPAFPIAEWERQKGLLADWEFCQKYRGIPTKPAGLVYDCFAPMPPGQENRGIPPEGWKYNTCKRFQIPPLWRVLVGIDFGGVNTAAVILVEERIRETFDRWGPPTGRYFLVGAYHEGKQMQMRDHVVGIMKQVNLALGRVMTSAPLMVGGSHQEGGWREATGIAVGEGVIEPPTNSVDVQIQYGYQLLKSKRVIVCDDLTLMVNDFNDFSREIDKDTGEILPKYKDEVKYHRLAGYRYVACFIARMIPK